MSAVRPIVGPPNLGVTLDFCRLLGDNRGVTLTISRPTPALPPFLILPLRESPRELRGAPASLAVIVASLVVVALGGVWPSITRALEATTTGLADGQVWRLVTYVLPHEHGWWHVLVNMVVLASFGWQYERIVGAGRCLAVYAGSGAVGMALLSAFHPIGAEQGLRAGASLAVFGVVAALAALHVLDGGWRGPAVPWAVGTTLFLLVASGLVAIDGHSGAAAPGVDAFWFGFLNHLLGVVAGVVVGLAVPAQPTGRTRWFAASLAVLALVAGVGVGLARWT